jgi:hypothetical protein
MKKTKLKSKDSSLEISKPIIYILYIIGLLILVSFGKNYLNKTKEEKRLSIISNTYGDKHDLIAGKTVFFDFGKRIGKNKYIRFMDDNNVKGATIKVVYFPSGRTFTTNDNNPIVNCYSIADTGCYVTSDKDMKGMAIDVVPKK